MCPRHDPRADAFVQPAVVSWTRTPRSVSVACITRPFRTWNCHGHFLVTRSRLLSASWEDGARAPVAIACLRRSHVDGHRVWHRADETDNDHEGRYVVGASDGGRGMFVGAEVVEPEAYSITPGFPWTKPAVSTDGILAPVQLCRSVPPATLPSAVYYFEAIRTGSAIVSVPLSRSWLRRSRGCQTPALPQPGPRSSKW